MERITDYASYEPVDNSVFLKIEPNSSVRLRIVSPCCHYEKVFRENEPARERFAWLVITKTPKAGSQGIEKAVKVFEGGPSIYKAVRNIVLNEDYGDPTGYDITVTRKGAGLDTEYSLVPSPPKALTKEDEALVKEADINLEEVIAGRGDSATPSQTVAADEYDPFADE